MTPDEKADAPESMISGAATPQHAQIEPNTDYSPTTTPEQRPQDPETPVPPGPAISADTQVPVDSPVICDQPHDVEIAEQGVLPVTPLPLSFASTPMSRPTSPTLLQLLDRFPLPKSTGPLPGPSPRLPYQFNPVMPPDVVLDSLRVVENWVANRVGLPTYGKLTGQDIKIFEERLENLITVQRMAADIARNAQLKYCEYTKAIFYKMRQKIDSQRYKQRRQQQTSDDDGDTETDEEGKGKKGKRKSKRKETLNSTC